MKKNKLVIEKMQVIMLGESLDRSGGIVSIQKLILKNTPDEVEINLIPTLRDGSKLYKTIVFIQAFSQLFWRLSTKKTDLVYIHVAERGSAFRQAATTTLAWLFQKPVILHSNTADFHVFYPNLPPILRSGFRWAFGNATRFVVVSKSWKDFFVENLELKAERVTILPNPVKIPVEVPHRMNADQITFIFLGKIGDRKGAFDLITAFAAIPLAQREKTKLIMAGDGEVEKARNMVTELQLTQQITIFDWIDEVKRNELLESSNIFILPTYNEGLPMALLEAMSWGLPCITTPVGGIPEVIIPHQNGLLITPGDIKQLTEAMQSLIEDESLRISLGNAARETVLPLEVGKYCEQLTSIFSECSVNQIK
jgi:glycosyltransferase involved in cell wall biosynthesis